MNDAPDAASAPTDTTLSEVTVALWRGDEDEARSYTDQLLSQSQRVASGQRLSEARG